MKIQTILYPQKFDPAKSFTCSAFWGLYLSLTSSIDTRNKSRLPRRISSISNLWLARHYLHFTLVIKLQNMRTRSSERRYNACLGVRLVFLLQITGCPGDTAKERRHLGQKCVGALDGLTDVGHSVGSACMDRLTLKPYSVKVRIVVEMRIHDYSSLLHFPLETGLLTFSVGPFWGF